MPWLLHNLVAWSHNVENDVILVFTITGLESYSIFTIRQNWSATEFNCCYLPNGKVAVNREMLLVLPEYYKSHSSGPMINVNPASVHVLQLLWLWGDNQSWLVTFYDCLPLTIPSIFITWVGFKLWRSCYRHTWVSAARVGMRRRSSYRVSWPDQMLSSTNYPGFWTGVFRFSIQLIVSVSLKAA